VEKDLNSGVQYVTPVIDFHLSNKQIITVEITDFNTLVESQVKIIPHNSGKGFEFWCAQYMEAEQHQISD
jgi:hypothetical protein